MKFNELKKGDIIYILEIDKRDLMPYLLKGSVSEISQERMGILEGNKQVKVIDLVIMERNNPIQVQGIVAENEWVKVGNALYTPNSSIIIGQTKFAIQSDEDTLSSIEMFQQRIEENKKILAEFGVKDEKPIDIEKTISDKVSEQINPVKEEMSEIKGILSSVLAELKKPSKTDKS